MKNLKLVLVSCCAPCSAGAIAQLKSETSNPKSEISDFIVLFFNPNIYPKTEYQKRLAEQVRYCNELNVKYYIGHYDHNAWLHDVTGYENEPERGRRCIACFKHRFRYAAAFAHDNGYNAIASVLGVSRHKDQSQVDTAAICELRFADSKLKYISIDPNTNQQLEIRNQKSFYRQNYCGCEFSIRK